MKVLDAVEIVSVQGIDRYGVKMGSVGVIHRINMDRNPPIYYVAFNYPVTAGNTDPDCVWVETQHIKLLERTR